MRYQWWSCRELNPGPSSLCQGFSVRSSRGISTRPSGSVEHVQMMGPVGGMKSYPTPSTRLGSKSLSRCRLPGQGQTWADRHAVAVLGSEGVVALSILGAYEFATTLTVVSSLHRHASPDSMYEVETISAPCILHAGSRARTAWKDFLLYYTLDQEG